MAHRLEIPRESVLLGRLAAGTAGVVGAAFLRRLVAELAGALDAELAFIAELNDDRPGWATTIASAGKPGVELREGHAFELAGTPCEHAYEHPVLLVPTGARERYPADSFLQAHGLDGYLAIALRDSSCRPIGHIGVVKRAALDPEPAEIQALYVFAARASAELERRRHEQALAAARARVVQAADDERARIGRDLHDGAQQRLVVLGQALELALRELEDDPAKAHERLTVARDQAAVARRELRELAQGLHPVGLEHGLRGALASLALHSPLPLRIGELPQRRHPSVVEATVWFVVSEALSNALKHARANELHVSAVEQDNTLVAEVTDDGAGGACTTRGTGLKGLAARVESLGGRLHVTSPRGAGTKLVATIPLTV